MNFLKVATVSVAVFVSACSVPEIEFPAAMVLRFNDTGTIWKLSGKMYGNVDGSSRYTLVGDGQTCQGTTTVLPDGDSLGTISCVGADGSEYGSSNVIPKEDVSMSFSGIFVTLDFSTPRGSVDSAFGWGRKADVNLLLAAIN